MIRNIVSFYFFIFLLIGLQVFPRVKYMALFFSAPFASTFSLKPLIMSVQFILRYNLVQFLHLTEDETDV